MDFFVFLIKLLKINLKSINPTNGERNTISCLFISTIFNTVIIKMLTKHESKTIITSIIKI